MPPGKPLRTPSRSGLLAACALCALLIACVSASPASASKVLLSEEGVAGVQGERAEFGVEWTITAIHTGCHGFDPASTLGRNPSSTSTIFGSDVDVVDKYCFNSEGHQTNGGLTFKKAQISYLGTVTVSMSTAVEATNGCKYALTKLTASTAFPSEWGYFLHGTAKLQPHVTQPSGCVASYAVEGFADVFPAGRYPTYQVSLTT
jgi:hypothetical protein